MIIGKLPQQHYGEIPQKNPMRWVMLHRTGENEFTAQTAEIKCKDFFNDTLCYFKTGAEFNMYGYASKKLKNDEGVYFLLRHIGDMASFSHNINVLNDKMKEQTGEYIVLWEQSKTEAIVLIPNSMWESTWRLSLVTMLIRCCNYGYRYDKWEDFYRTDAPLNQQEQSFDHRAKTNTKAWGFNVPAEYAKYWFYCGDMHNSEKTPNQTGGVIHNNGCTNWSYYMKSVNEQNKNKSESDKCAATPATTS